MFPDLAQYIIIMIYDAAVLKTLKDRIIKYSPATDKATEEKAGVLAAAIEDACFALCSNTKVNAFFLLKYYSLILSS